MSNQIRSLDSFFRPRSIAVIGASRHRGTIGAEVFHNLLEQGFTGSVYPVNLNADVVQSIKAYPSIVQVPGLVDLAVLIVPPDDILKTVDECAQHGVHSLLVITAGFAECGVQGKNLQSELVQQSKRQGMRIMGPNCLGLLNTDPAFRVNATFAPSQPPVGKISIASQSGAVGLLLLDEAMDQGIGIHQFASLGNKADVSENDLLAYWEDDPNTQAILLYVESFSDAQQFLQIARRISRKKPIFTLKSGRTRAGIRAAASHTDALATPDVAVEALLHQAGVVRVDTPQELFESALFYAHDRPHPLGARVAILTNAGGPGIMAADACERQGLSLPKMSTKTIDQLRDFLPSYSALSNPIDMGAGASANDYEQALRILLMDEEVDSVLVLFVPAMVTIPTEAVHAILRASGGTTKPVLPCFLGKSGISEAVNIFRVSNFPFYPSLESAVLALARVLQYERLRNRPPGIAPPFPDIQLEDTRRLFHSYPSGWLLPKDVQQLLAMYGIRSPRTVVAQNLQEAAEAADKIGYPVALKLFSSTILHKTEIGGVFLNLTSRAAVCHSYESLLQNLAARHLSDQIQGVTVQEMFQGGVETLIGVTQAQGIGALVAFGMGGVNVEIWSDIVFRIHPLTDIDVCEMVEQIRGKPLLQGFRGSPPADKEALIDAILRISRMIQDFPEIQELDINPLSVLSKGHGVVALDARIRVSKRVADS